MLNRNKPSVVRFIRIQVSPLARQQCLYESALCVIHSGEPHEPRAQNTKLLIVRTSESMNCELSSRTELNTSYVYQMASSRGKDHDLVFLLRAHT